MNPAKRSVIPPEEMAELERAVSDAVRGVWDPEAIDRAFEEMDRAREELRQEVGELNVAVDLIREGRDEE